MNAPLKPGGIKPDHRTVAQLLAAARKDSDMVSVFYNGATEADTRGAILVVKDNQVLQGLLAYLLRQRLVTVKPVDKPADVDVANPATCAGCGCTDRQACAGGCYWLGVDRTAKTGVCSSCTQALTAWRNQKADA